MGFQFSSAYWVIQHAFLSSAVFFFQNQLFRKILSGIPSECQAVLNQIKPDVLSGLIWVQTVFKGYQQMTPVVRVISSNLPWLITQVVKEITPSTYLHCFCLASTSWPGWGATKLQMQGTSQCQVTSEKQQSPYYIKYISIIIWCHL